MLFRSVTLLCALVAYPVAYGLATMPPAWAAAGIRGARLPLLLDRLVFGLVLRLTFAGVRLTLLQLAQKRLSRP